MRVIQVTTPPGQLAFWPAPLFNAQWPSAGTNADKLLMELAKRGPITQLEWLALGMGWRLAATVNELNRLGWRLTEARTHRRGCDVSISEYSLTAPALQAVLRGRGGRP
jgi:ABC-type phosphate transport system auxiliary subunit